MTDHYEQMSMCATDGPIYTCSCGEIFSIREDLIEHMLDLQGTAFTLVTLCGDSPNDHGYTWGIKVKEGCVEWAVKDCNYCKRRLSQRGPDIQCQLSHWQSHHMRDVPIMNNWSAGDHPTPIGLPEVEHTWQNWLDAVGPKELESPPYICKCGEEFEAHDLLMKHTSKLNPSISTFDMGSAGVGIERSAHENTLALLKRARNILFKQKFGSVQQDVDEEVLSLLADIREQCTVFAEEDEKEFEELLDKQIERGDFLTKEQMKDMDPPFPPEPGYGDGNE